MHIKVGTRGSLLALAQTRGVIAKLQDRYPEDTFEEVVIKTTGDAVTNKPIDQIGSKGLFIDAIEDRLLSGDIQLAVHSMKDMPAKLSDGLTFTRAMRRADARDVLILREATCIEELSKNAVIATGSKRREYQLKAIRQDIRFVGIRGNIDTRINKLYTPREDGSLLDGIVLAAAGLHRLNMQDKITQYMTIEQMIPAPTQGILAIEARSDNTKLINMVNVLSDDNTQKQAEIERQFLLESGCDCHNPVGAYYDIDSHILHGYIGNEDGTDIRITRQRIE